jgi:cupin fold WbuC family metalloprotein
MKLIPTAMLDELAARAAASPRLRTNHNLHEAPADVLQRYFIVALRDSYFRPHRHPAKGETALVIRGRLDVLMFDPAGTVVARYAMGDGAPNLGYETPPGTWHSLVLHSASAAFFETKEGPYDPATAVEAAPWAPVEGDANARAYLDWMRAAAAGARWTG